MPFLVYLYFDWRGGRAVECGSLENCCPSQTDRGFESHPLRQPSSAAADYGWLRQTKQAAGEVRRAEALAKAVKLET